MSVNSELNGIYVRLLALEDEAKARGFILEGLCATLAHANPELYKMLVDGVMDDLNDVDE